MSQFSDTDTYVNFFDIKIAILYGNSREKIHVEFPKGVEEKM
jgi:hypothetical protein